MEPRKALYDVLYYAILEMRVFVAPGHGNLPAAMMLANMVHNLPRALEAAQHPEDYDAILATMWERSAWQEGGREWLRRTLQYIGFDVTTLEDSAS